VQPYPGPSGRWQIFDRQPFGSHVEARGVYQRREPEKAPQAAAGHGLILALSSDSHPDGRAARSEVPEFVKEFGSPHWTISASGSSVKQCKPAFFPTASSGFRACAAERRSLSLSLFLQPPAERWDSGRCGQARLHVQLEAPVGPHMRRTIRSRASRPLRVRGTHFCSQGCLNRSRIHIL